MCSSATVHRTSTISRIASAVRMAEAVPLFVTWIMQVVLGSHGMDFVFLSPLLHETAGTEPWGVVRTVRDTVRHSNNYGEMAV